MKAGAYVLGLVALGALAACSSSSGPLPPADSSAADTLDDTWTTDVGSDSSVDASGDSAPLCTIHTLGAPDGGFDATECGKCLGVACANWDTMCTADPACSAQFDCIYACSPPSVACKQGCKTQHPSPVADCYFDCMNWDCGYVCR